jgi:hypothetical protein
MVSRNEMKNMAANKAAEMFMAAAPWAYFSFFPVSGSSNYCFDSWQASFV